jgi:hypothetical protein
MKHLILIALCCAPILGVAQSTKEIEKAYFEVTKNGESAYFTDVYATSTPFNKEQFFLIKEYAMEKEGIFDVQLLDDGKTIRFAHLSYVLEETIKHFALLGSESISVEPRETYFFSL